MGGDYPILTSGMTLKNVKIHPSKKEHIHEKNNINNNKRGRWCLGDIRGSKKTKTKRQKRRIKREGDIEKHVVSILGCLSQVRVLFSRRTPSTFLSLY